VGGITFTATDLVVFLGFLALVVGVSLYASRRERSTEDYFLAGRKLTWWLIGLSLIASNISTEHFVGMAGQAYSDIGLAVASWEWIAAVTLVVVAIWLLPKFLSAGIYTMPEYLEHRFDHGTRAIMAGYLMAAYVIVLLAGVLYTGATMLNGIFGLPELFAGWFELSTAADAPWQESAKVWSTVAGVWLIGIIAGAYTIYGGLTAVVWSDLIQGGALLLGGALVTVLALNELGDGSLLDGWSTFVTHNEAKLHVIKPLDHPELPWLAVLIGGMWIPNFFYWGLNQFITQRALGAKSLAEGQKGILFAALLKLVIPFIIVMPGIMAFQLYGQKLGEGAGDSAYPHMIANLLPPEFRGIMLAALCGAVMSTFNSGVNSASTIFTIDLYKRYLKPDSTPANDVRVGRWATAVFVLIACLWAPFILSFEGVFKYIQEIWGFISPGILAVFVVGLLNKRTPPAAAKTGLVLGLALYAICRFGEHFLPGQWIADFNAWPYLHHMALIFLTLVTVMLVMTKLAPLAEPRVMPTSRIDVTPHPRVKLYGGIVVLLTAMLYAIFW